jgi:hypothetical protein
MSTAEDDDLPQHQQGAVNDGKQQRCQDDKVSRGQMSRVSQHELWLAAMLLAAACQAACNRGADKLHAITVLQLLMTSTVPTAM